MKKTVALRTPIEDGSFALPVHFFGNGTSLLFGDDDSFVVSSGSQKKPSLFLFGDDDEDDMYAPEAYALEPQVASFEKPKSTSFAVHATPPRVKATVYHSTPQRILEGISPDAKVYKKIEGGEGVVELYQDRELFFAKKTGLGVETEYYDLATVESKENSPYVVRARRDSTILENHMLMDLANGDLDQYTPQISELLHSEKSDAFKSFFFLSMAGMILDGMKSIHSSLDKVICDVKPMNVLLFNTRTLAVADLGAVVSPGKKQEGYTPSYAAPELFPESIKDNLDMTSIKVGFYSDVWGFGAMMYKSVFGRMYIRDIPGVSIEDINDPYQYGSLFTPTNMQKLQTGISEKIAGLPEDLQRHVQTLVQSCLRINPDARPSLSDLQLHVYTALLGFENHESLLAEYKKTWVLFQEKVS
jgi:serine/threonine protein kinase